jgi:hypothetical protein
MTFHDGAVILLQQLLVALQTITLNLHQIPCILFQLKHKCERRLIGRCVGLAGLGVHIILQRCSCFQAQVSHQYKVRVLDHEYED